MLRRQDEVRLMSQLETDDCIKWCIGKPNKGGYYYVRVGKVNDAVHRIAFEFHHGALLTGEVVRHMCDTPNCINPRHLTKGTQQDNMTDKVERDRQRKGVEVPSSILTEKQVLEIRDLRGTMLQRDIASRYGITQTHVSQIHRRMIWKHI